MKSIAILLAILVGLPLSQTGISNMAIVGRFTKYNNVGYAETWGWTAPDGHEYAIIASESGVSFLDLEKFQNQSTMELAEITYIPGSRSIWHDMKTYKNYCYMVSDQGNQALQIVDMSNLPTRATLVKAWAGDAGAAISQVHNIYIDTARALLYAMGPRTSSTIIIDIKDPVNPKTLSVIPGENHDIHANGNLLILSTGGSGSIKYFNVSNPSSPRQLLNDRLPSGENGYSHQCWSKSSGDVLMCTIETGGKSVLVYDISKVLTGGQPVLTDKFPVPAGNVAHNVIIEGDVAYIAHYTKGVRAVDIRDIYDVKEIAYHDASTSGDIYGGSWGVYPFFPSGKIAQTDRQNGTYVLQPDVKIVPITGKWPTPIGYKNLNSNFRIRLMGNNQIKVFTPDAGEYLAKVFAMNGKAVLQTKIEGSEPVIKWDGAWLTSGSYVLQLTGKEKMKPLTFNIQQ